MKTQIRPTIKAYLLRSGVYLVLLVAVCVVPLALAQRNAAERATQVDNQNLAGDSAPAGFKGPTLLGTSLLPLQSSGSLGANLVVAPPPPKYPLVILYDQYNNPGTMGTVASAFTDSPSHSVDLADDFVVPAGQTWNVQSIDAEGRYFNGPGPANSFNVFIYADSAGFPGTQVSSTLNQTWTQNGFTFTVSLSPAAVLTAGTYWIEIQANMTDNPNGEWGWADRTVTSNNAAAFRNPGGGFGLCPSWSRRAATCGIDPSEPDQVWRINGTIGGPTGPEGCYPGFTTAEGCNALNSLTSGAGNTAVGWYSLFVDTTGNFNTGLGGGTLVLNNADSNTATGAAALLLNGDGVQNCAYGTDALVYNGENVSGADFNNAFGAFALFNNTSGFTNNAVGNHALFENLSAAANTAVGDEALQNNDFSGAGNGHSNTAVGAQALLANVDGDSNNAVGYSALENGTEIVQNNVIGTFALMNNNGASNVGIGDSAFVNSTTGSLNTIIGWQAGTGTGVDGDDNIYIGATSGPANGSENGAIRIGDPGFVSSCYIAGISGQSSSGGVPVLINASGKLGTAPADSPFSMNDVLKRQRTVQDLKVTAEKQQATIALQQSQIEALTAGVREQAAQIRKVSAQLEQSEPEPKTVLNNQ